MSGGVHGAIIVGACVVGLLSVNSVLAAFQSPVGPTPAGQAPAGKTLAGQTSAAQARGSDTQLVPIPRPNLDPEEEAVRRQLIQKRGGLDALLEASPRPTDPLVAALGELGGLYYLYDLRDAARACFDNASRLAPDEPQWRYLLAVLLDLEGRKEEALGQFDRVLELAPENVPTLIRKGRSLFDLARYEDARTAFERALSLDGSNPGALGGLGNVQVRLKDFEAAIPNLERALVLQPEANSLYYPLATALRATGKVEEAREAFAQNNSGRLFFPDPWVTGIEELSASSEGLFHAGNRAMRSGDMAAAASYLERFTAAKPEHVKGRFNLALSYLQLGRQQDAMDLLRGVLADDPEVRGGHRLLADVLAESGQLEASLPHFERAFNSDPASATAADWATVLAKLGRVDEGLELLKPFVGPGSQEHYARLKYATILATSGSGTRAMPILRDLAESSGLRKVLRSEAMYHVGSLQLSDGQNEAGRSSLELALELDPESVLAASALAPLLAREGQWNRAAELFSQTIAAEPDNERAQFGLAMTQMLDGQDRAARTSLEGALEVIPGNVSLQHALARLLATSSDATVRDGERAVVMARELLRQTPNPEFAQTLAMALAEVGDFDQAILLQEQVIRRAQESGLAGPQQSVLLERLESYRAKTPVRSPWASGP